MYEDRTPIPIPTHPLRKLTTKETLSEQRGHVARTERPTIGGIQRDAYAQRADAQINAITTDAAHVIPPELHVSYFVRMDTGTTQRARMRQRASPPPMGENHISGVKPTRLCRK